MIYIHYTLTLLSSTFLCRRLFEHFPIDDVGKNHFSPKLDYNPPQTFETDLANGIANPDF
jgi:hypothetical protein